METLNTKIIDNFDLQNYLIRIVDIINFEGPLLSLFRNIKNEHLYLFDWVDRNNSYNRWLIYQTNPHTLHKYIKKEISHYDLFIAEEQYCNIIDIRTDLVWKNAHLIKKDSIPISYVPMKDVYFEDCDCSDFEKLKEFVISSRASQKQENLVVYANLLTNFNTNIYKINFNKKIKHFPNTIISNKILTKKQIRNNKISISKYSQFDNKIHQTIKQNCYV